MGNVWRVLAWVWTGSKAPAKTSSFSLFDLGFRTQVFDEVGGTDIHQASNTEIVRVVKDVRVFDRSVSAVGGDGNQRI
jgi:hypothetical protein